MRALILGVLCLGLSAPAAAGPAAAGAPWPFLPNDDIGAYAFKQAHPTWDGRGVVVAIFDTGVDAFAPGLTVTSTGETKVIEARDFSTEGDWDLVEAERDTSGAPAFRHPDGLRLTGLPAGAPAPGRDDRVYIGIIPESRFLNSNGVTDLNDDGDRDDRFGVLVWAADRAAVEAALGTGRGLERLAALNDTARRTVARERAGARVWLVAVDTDGDGSLADEAALRDYHVNYDTFRLTAPDAPQSRTLMAWSANVITQDDRLGTPRPPRLELHFDDGAHGSHCAGIATGCGVSGQAGMDGVAPGAWLMSCKIGDNTLAGGSSRTESMRRAFAHATDFARDYGLPLVISMSYGVLSVEEGAGAYEKFLDEEMPKHPGVVYCTSAGNEGPGLSSVGMPAASPCVIASGAYLSPAAGAALYGARMPRAELYGFSSRGGVVPKPDVVAPGGALSTVPGWVDGSARMNGTSMACPTTAGAAACLLGAARQEGLTVHWGMVKRALIVGARPVPGVELPSQGGGLVDLTGAWGVLAQLARSRTAADVLDYRLETECPFQADGLAPAAYWRVPGGTPVAPKTVTFKVHPVFHPDLTPDRKDAFFRAFTFRPEADWVRVVTGRTYVRGDMDMTVELQYDGAQLARPGLYATRVLALQDGGDLSGPAAQEFSLWNTVVVGEPFGPAGDWSRSWDGRDLPPSGVNRRFVVAPAGATAMRVRLEVSGRTGAGRGARVSTEICDPEGRTRGDYVGVASLEGVSVRDQTILPPELRPGIWEVLCTAPIAALEPSAYRLTVSFDAYTCEPPVLAALPRVAAGQPARGGLTVTRAFPGVFRGGAQAVVQGFRREREIAVEAVDVWSLDFTLDRTTPRAAFHLAMDEATANLFTDCAVNIVDDQGKRVVTDGFAGLDARVAWSLPAGVEKGTYKLEVVGGFALARDREKWGFRLTEEYLLAAPVTGGVTQDDAGDFALYSGVPTPLEVAFADSWPAPPAGLSPFGSVKFLDRNLEDRVPGDRDGRLVLEVPIRLE
ncbi:MAG: S8 family serine peptidase [Candidatus Krumholzibacteriia bacterium]